MENRAKAVQASLPSAAPADQFTATFWAQWRTQLRVVLQKPWLAATWFKQSRTLWERYNRIYTHLCHQPRPVRRRLQRQLGATLAGAALALTLTNLPVQAGDFSANDEPTLIAAINAANDETANPGPDTITLTTNITLTTANVTNTTTFDFNLGLPPVTTTITLEGGGFTLARDPDGENFTLLGVYESGDLTLNDITITGGRGLSGGVVNASAALTINNSTFQNNLGLVGGAMLSKYGTTSITNSTFTSNTGIKYGGAIFAVGETTITGSTITGNQAAYNAGGLVGGYSTTIDSSQITENTAKYGNSGGIANFGVSLTSVMTLTNSLIADNTASGQEDGGGLGGGLYNRNGFVSLIDSTVSGNSSGFSGGGIFSSYQPRTAAASAARATLPAAAMDQLAEHGIDAAQLREWAAALEGLKAQHVGAARVQARTDAGPNLLLLNSTVTDNTAGTNRETTRTNDDDGGGIANEGGSLVLINSTVSGNQAPNRMTNFLGMGGGIYNSYNGTLTLENSTVTGNVAGNTGGGITNGYSSAGMTLARTIVSGNAAPSCSEIDNYSSGGTVAPYTADAFNLLGHRGLTNAKAFTCRKGVFTPGASDITATRNGTKPTILTSILDTTLANNGGTTATHALVSGSPAFDAAGDSGLDTDQRGSGRPQGTADDIGAVEMPAATLTIEVDANPDLPTNLGFTGTLGGFLLDDPGSDDGDAYTNTRTFTVVPGVYTVQRNNPLTRFTTQIECTPSSGAVINLAQRRATVTLAEGDNVVCTFTINSSVTINARVFNDLVRNHANLGKRNAADTWLTGWEISVATSPTSTVGSGSTAPTGAVEQASFIGLPAGTYTVCATLPDASWTPSNPAELDSEFGKPCKEVTLNAGESALVLFGAYQATVVASEATTPADEVITDEDTIITMPYNPADDETVPDEADGPRYFLPWVSR